MMDPIYIMLAALYILVGAYVMACTRGAPALYHRRTPNGYELIVSTLIFMIIIWPIAVFAKPFRR